MSETTDELFGLELIEEQLRDKRPIAEMPFGAEAKTSEEREAVATRVRHILDSCGCAVGDDINKLGCTGVMALWAPENTRERSQVEALELSLEIGRFLRIGLAGGGVGLPCFVPSSRYCLIHETIGGLQEGQAAHHVEFVEKVSRELTPEEAARMVVVERARRIKPGSASPETTQHAVDFLAGRRPGEVVDAFRAMAGGAQHGSVVDLDDAEPGADLSKYRLGEPTAWVCLTHRETDWACRHCVAQLVVAGDLEPTFVVQGVSANDDGPIGPTALTTALDDWNNRGIEHVAIYALAKTLRRRLA